jgi:hypothetical protein
VRGLTAVLGAGAGAGIIYMWLAGGEPGNAPAPVARKTTEPAALAVVARPAVEHRQYGPEPIAIDMAPVFTDGGLRVLLRDEVRSGWLRGRPSMSDDDGVTVVTRPLNNAGQAEVASAIGARLRLYRPDGSSCRARVTGAVALGRVDAGGNLDPKAGAAGAWAATRTHHEIAGDLEPLDGRCEDVLWARSESLPAPRIAAEREVSQEVRRQAELALRARPEYRQLTDGTGSEEEEIEVASLVAGDETLVATTFVSEGCAGKSPVLVALWERRPGGALRFLGAEEWVSDVVTGADVDGDGRMEVLVEDDLLGAAVLRRSEGHFATEQRASVPILGCRC